MDIYLDRLSITNLGEYTFCAKNLFDGIFTCLYCSLLSLVEAMQNSSEAQTSPHHLPHTFPYVQCSA